MIHRHRGGEVMDRVHESRMAQADVAQNNSGFQGTQGSRME